MFAVLCKRGAEKKWWVAKQCATMAEAKGKVAELRKTDKQFRMTGLWLYKIEELTKEEMLERYF